MTTAMPERALEAEHSLSGICFFLRLAASGRALQSVLKGQGATPSCHCREECLHMTHVDRRAPLRNATLSWTR